MSSNALLSKPAQAQPLACGRSEARLRWARKPLAGSQVQRKALCFKQVELNTKEGPGSAPLRPQPRPSAIYRGACGTAHARSTPAHTAPRGNDLGCVAAHAQGNGPPNSFGNAVAHARGTTCPHQPSQAAASREPLRMRRPRPRRSPPAFSRSPWPLPGFRSQLLRGK